MTGDRFYVVGLFGYTINPESSGSGTGGKARPRTTYSVLDRDYCHREVLRVGPLLQPGPDEKRKRIAERRCAELNAWARVQERVA